MKCTAFRASGLSITAARNHFGFQNIVERLSRLDESIEEVVSLRACIDNLSHVQEKSFIVSLGAMTVIIHKAVMMKMSP